MNSDTQKPKENWKKISIFRKIHYKVGKTIQKVDL